MYVFVVLCQALPMFFSVACEKSGRCGCFFFVYRRLSCFSLELCNAILLTYPTGNVVAGMYVMIIFNLANG